jgi:hypothetical protein
MKLEPTKYYDEFLRYYDMAKTQQILCNIGDTPYINSGVQDDLMEYVELYDVVERKYAGFSQIINDIFYSTTDEHPYIEKIKSNNISYHRRVLISDWENKHNDFGLTEWLYLFILHRVCGSGINYSLNPSGYHNTIIFSLSKAKNIDQMVNIIKSCQYSFYTSIGYQFPSFPTPPGNYRRGGDYYLCEYAPKLAKELSQYLLIGGKKDFRELGSFMLNWNTKHGLRQYHFQYAAVIADIADWYPQYVNKDSLFYYGTNAKECISYLANKPKGMKTDVFLDFVMGMIRDDTGASPYNAEDVCCDFIRWVENYVRPGAAYDHLNFDTLFSSCKIHDHPYGRQQNMLKLNLVKSFNNMKSHPSDDFIIKAGGIDVDTYKMMCKDI